MQVSQNFKKNLPAPRLRGQGYSPKTKSTAIPSALSKADIIAVQILSEDGLALSVIASQCHLSQRERLSLFVQGERLGQGQHPGGDVVFLLVVVPDAVGDAVRDDLHLGLAHAPGGDGRSAQTDAGGHKGAAGLAGDRVLVGGDVDAVEAGFRSFRPRLFP